MNNNIVQYIQSQTCASIACIDESGNPYCFSCYYVFNAEDGMLYFKSSVDSHHATLLKNSPYIAGTILPDKLNKLLVKGIQFEATILNELNPLAATASAIYHKKLPLALAIAGEVWTIQLNKIKMTDSTLGFGKKISWNRND